MLEMSKMTIKFTVSGNPVPQGRMLGFYRGNKVVVTNSRAKELGAWRLSIAGVAQGHAPIPIWDGAIYLRLVFMMPRPKSSVDKCRCGHSERLHQDRRRAPICRSPCVCGGYSVMAKKPITRPDIDKLIRGVADALTGVIFSDDSQIVTIVADKVYNSTPGVIVEVTHLDGRP